VGRLALTQPRCSSGLCAAVLPFAKRHKTAILSAGARVRSWVGGEEEGGAEEVNKHWKDPKTWVSLAIAAVAAQFVWWFLQGQQIVFG